MAVTPSHARTFSSAIGDDAVRFGDRILWVILSELFVWAPGATP